MFHIRTDKELDQEQNTKPLQKELKEMYIRYDKEAPSPIKLRRQQEIILYEKRIIEIRRRNKLMNNKKG